MYGYYLPYCVILEKALVSAWILKEQESTFYPKMMVEVLDGFVGPNWAKHVS